MLQGLDSGIGEVVRSLKRRGMFHNSVILFSTDNGGGRDQGRRRTSSNFPLRGKKEELYEGGVRGVAFLAGGALPTSQTESDE